MVQAIVLAAGRSERMGLENKLLMSIGDKTVLRATMENLCHSIIDKITVVTGFDYDETINELGDLDAEIIYNGSHKEGMTSSIKAGISQLKGELEQLMICLADMPLLKPEDYNALIEFYREVSLSDSKPIVRPAYGENFGHPVIFHPSYSKQLLSTTHHNGSREVINDHRKHLHLFEAKGIKYFFDIDTPKDYNRLIRYLDL